MLELLSIGFQRKNDTLFHCGIDGRLLRSEIPDEAHRLVFTNGSAFKGAFGKGFPDPKPHELANMNTHGVLL